MKTFRIFDIVAFESNNIFQKVLESRLKFGKKMKHFLVNRS